MGKIDRRLEELGLRLPSEPRLPPGIDIPFQWVRVRGRRAFLAGHGALSEDGSPRGPFGKVPSQVSVEEAQESACSAVLSMLASLARALGDLDHVAAWMMLFGNVNADPDYPYTNLVLNPASALLVELYGADRGAHARTSIGMAALPFRLPVIIAAEIELAS